MMRSFVDRKIAELDITGRCLNSCPFCYQRDKEEYADMAFVQVEANIEKCVRNGCDTAIVIGGEPMLHGGVGEVLRACQFSGMYTILWTSGTLDCEHILGNVDELRVSRNALTDYECSLVFGSPVLPHETLARYAKTCNVVVTTLINTNGVHDHKTASKFLDFYGKVSGNDVLALDYRVRSSTVYKPNVRLRDIELPNGFTKEIPANSGDFFYAVCGVVYRTYCPVE